MQTQIIPSQITLPENAVVFHDSQPRTTSIKVADAFGKLHKNVIRKLKTLECSDFFNRLNFKPVDYVDSKGEKRPMYEMTKDGFMFLVMGFTGKKAAAIKEAYINEFNRMADTLLNKPSDTADRKALNVAVRSLANARSERGGRADFAGVWRIVNGYLGLKTISEASNAQVSQALRFVQNAIEGEYLSAIPLPISDVLAFPKSRAFSSYRNSELYGPDATSGSLSCLLAKLNKAARTNGTIKIADVSGAVEELKALKHQLEVQNNKIYAAQANVKMTDQILSR